MGLEALVRGNSYGAYIGDLAKKAVSGITTFAQEIFVSNRPSKTAKDLLSYCIVPADSRFAAKLSCGLKSDVTLNEFKLLITNCSAIQVVDEICKVFESEAAYGWCGNFRVCTLKYNGPINACFNETLTATVPSCLPPSDDYLIPIYVIAGFAAVGALAVTAGACYSKREAITDKICSLFKCCNRGYRTIE